jgi:hypothetical protein
LSLCLYLSVCRGYVVHYVTACGRVRLGRRFAIDGVSRRCVDVVVEVEVEVEESNMVARAWAEVTMRDADPGLVSDVGPCLVLRSP